MEPSMAKPDGKPDVLACSETPISNKTNHIHGEERILHEILNPVSNGFMENDDHIKGTTKSSDAVEELFKLDWRNIPQHIPSCETLCKPVTDTSPTIFG
jgi:hypothetical protein